MTASTTTVRRLRPEEVEAYRSLRLRSLQADPAAFGSTYEREVAYPKDRWETRVRNGATSPTESTWVAEAPGGEIVGMCVIVRLEGKFGVFGMWVDPKFRGQHLGSRLLDRALRWSQELDPSLPHALDVNPRQEEALRLYESRGFRRTGASQRLEHTESDVAVEMLRPASR